MTLSRGRDESKWDGVQSTLPFCVAGRVIGYKHCLHFLMSTDGISRGCEEHWVCSIMDIGTFILPKQQPLSDCLWNDLALALLLQGSTLQALQKPALIRCRVVQQNWDLWAPKHSQGKSWGTDRGSGQVQHNKLMKLRAPKVQPLWILKGKLPKALSVMIIHSKC